MSPGRVLGHYQIKNWLGAGTMGEVYRAVDTHLDRVVAIKVLRPEWVTLPERRQRFVQEAKAASALNHPNIVTIYDISSDDGVDYIAMEYVDGKTLRELIGRAGLPWGEAVRYGVQVTDALAAAHAAGLVHRDLKPANVMVEQHGRVKLLDFGLAKLIEPPEPEEWRAADPGSPTISGFVGLGPRTEEGAIVGTLAYMSPEQARGQPVDGRSDIFAFGSMFYEMLTGRRAFPGNSALAIQAAILMQEPGAPAGDAPPELERVLRRCLRKDPERRFQGMAEVKVELEEVKEQSDSRPLAVEPSAPATARTSRRAWLAAAAALLALSASGVTWWRGHAAAPPAEGPLLAVLPFRNVAGDPAGQAFCDGLVETVTSRLTKLQSLRRTAQVVAAGEVRRERITSGRQAWQAFGAALVVEGSVQRSGGHVVVVASLEDTRRGLQLHSETISMPVGDLPQLQDRVVEAIAAMLNPTAASTGSRLMQIAGGTAAPAAYDYYTQGRGYLQYPERAENVDGAISLFERALETDPQYALAQAGLGEAYWYKYNATKDRRWIDAAIEACRSAIRMNGELAPAHVTQALVYRGTGRYREATRELQRALQLDPLYPEAHRELASVYMALGKASEAEATYRHAIDLQPGYWAGYADLARFYFRRGRYAEAEGLFREVTRLTPDNARAYSNLGGVYHMMGRYEEAIAALNRSLAIKPSASAYSNLGTIYYFRGHFAEAVQPMEKAIEFGARDYQVQGNLADCYLRTPALAWKAAGAFREAARLAEESLRVNPKNARVRASLAFYRAQLGDRVQALAEVEEARRTSPDDGHVLFRAALVYELAGQRDRAMTALETAWKAGYSKDEIRRAADLAELRKDPRYARLETP